MSTHSIPHISTSTAVSGTEPLKTYEEQLEHWYGKCLQNPKWSDKVQLVSLEWLKSIANPSPSELTDLGVERKNAAGELVQVDMQQLSRDLKKNGLQEPLIVQYGLQTKRARLEAGNHRVQLLLDAGLMHAPCVLYVAASHMGHPGNGTHEGARVLAYDVSDQVVSVGPYTESKFCAIGAVLPSAPVYMGKSLMVGMGALPARVAPSSVVVEPMMPAVVAAPPTPVRVRKVRSDKGKSKEQTDASTTASGSVNGSNPVAAASEEQAAARLWEQ